MLFRSSQTVRDAVMARLQRCSSATRELAELVAISPGRTEIWLVEAVLGVRQAAADTDKRAELIVEGAAGEFDRQVLERMLPPFEHMLRNAVVHGIEKPDERVKRGKPDTGRIVLELHREGAEVMVRLTDDGCGMNLRAIRDKAEALGLDRKSTRLNSSHEIPSRMPSSA